MAQVPDNILSWLYDNLRRNEYQDPNRTFKDVVQTLSNYPSLRIRTEIYTFENGSSHLLVQLHGTVPVQFRGDKFWCPVTLWVPQSYPREGPMVYVIPTDGMVIRPGQHIYNNGRVFHPYLAQWAKYWDKSSIDDFLTVLRQVFAKDPPVMSSQQLQASLQPAVPPPAPPPPREYQSPPLPVIQSLKHGGPPQLPPKPGKERATQSPVPGPSSQSGPPLPPLPPQLREQSSHVPQRQFSAPLPMSFGNVMQSQTPISPAIQRVQYDQYRPHELESPVSPIQQESFPLQQPAFHQPQQISPYQGQQQVHFQPHQQQYPPNYQAPQQFQQPKKPAAPPIDLLSSPLDVTIPSQTGSLEPLPAPPIPPNPEKDALLSAISQSLVAETTRALESNKAAVPSLLAQQQALRNAYAALQLELEQLQNLDSALDSNERVLRGAIDEADNVMRDASGKKRPEVDDVLVCPTVVGSQLYALVADEKACEAARVALVRGLDKGRVSLDVFVKQTRSLAREEYMKKALIRKIATGMGLEQRPW